MHSQSTLARRATVLTVCLGSLALLAAVYWASVLRLPDPAAADREGLFRWLVLRDLDGESPEVRVALLRRFEEEADRGFDAQSLRSRLDARYREQVWDNVLVLVETWYTARLDAFRDASGAKRMAILDEMIADSRRWKSLAALRPAESPADAVVNDDAALLQILSQQVELWKSKASPERQREISQLDVALRGRWLMHALGLVSDEDAARKDAQP